MGCNIEGAHEAKQARQPKASNALHQVRRAKRSRHDDEEQMEPRFCGDAGCTVGGPAYAELHDVQDLGSSELRMTVVWPGI
jgi:hypothetical protein